MEDSTSVKISLAWPCYACAKNNRECNEPPCNSCTENVITDYPEGVEVKSYFSPILDPK